MLRKLTFFATHGLDSRMPRFRVRSVSLCLAGMTAVLASSMANAAVFGETVSISAIGTRFEVAVSSPGMTRENLANCVRLAGAPSTDGIATLRGGSLSVAGSGANARIVVSHPEPVFEPILRFTLQDVCATRLQRTYTLLMPEPAEVSRVAQGPSRPTTPTAQPRRAAAAAPAATAPQVWTTVQGESIASIAQALYPRDEGARRAFIDGVLRNNQDVLGAGRHPAAVLPSGTELRVPSLAAVAAASTEPRRAAPSVVAVPAAADAPPARVEPVAPPVTSPAPVVTERDRLVVDTGARDELAGREIDPDTSDEAIREERLVAALDRSIDAQLELLERIRRLEQLQEALRTQIEAAGPDQPVAVTRQPQEVAATSAPTTQPPPPSAGERIPERAGPAPAAASSTDNWFNWAIAGGLLALALLLLLRRRSADTTKPGRVERQARAPMTEAWPDEAPVGTGVDRQRQSELTVSPDQTLPPPIPPVLEWDGSLPRTAEKPATAEASSDMPTLPPAILVEEEPEEHESAVELAEIMLSFGRVHGAAETLEAFIESNPKQAIMPWLKLMEVYHTADMRREFDILATELNKTFNVCAVTWENFHDVSAHGEGIEALAHITARLQETWGTRQCQAYIDLLVRDNRQGTRMGFELGAVDDLLMLAGVLEVQLGRYKPGASA